MISGNFRQILGNFGEPKPPKKTVLWETDFYTPSVLGGAALLPFSATTLGNFEVSDPCSRHSGSHTECMKDASCKRGKTATTKILPPNLPDKFSKSPFLSMHSPTEARTESEACLHPFQNHYTHEIIVFKSFRGLQLQLSGVFRIKNIAVTVPWFSCRKQFLGNNSPRTFLRIFGSYNHIMYDLMVK